MFENKNEKALLSFIEDYAIPRFKEGRFTYLNVLYKAFVINTAVEYHKEIAKIFKELLSGISVKKLIRLSENCRAYYYSYEDYEITSYKVEWKEIRFEREQFSYLTDEEYIAILRLGTFHENGYFRQMCMECLEEFENNLSFYILRINDWVTQIRSLAYELSMAEIDKDDVLVLFAALPVIDKVMKSRRREKENINDLSVLAKKLIEEKIKFCSLEAIVKSEIIIKNMIYRYLNENNVLSINQMKKLLSMEKTGYGKGLIIQGILNNYECSMDEVDSYLLNKNTIVRFKALEYKYRKIKTSWLGLELMLMDKSKKIRDNVSFILRQNTDFNVLDYYKNQLKENKNLVAILGIAEHGSSKDIELILPYLQSENDIIVKKALKAYGMLMTYNGSELYWEYLFKPSALVWKEAYRQIKKYNVHYGGGRLFEAYKKHYDLPVAQNLVLLLLNEGVWSNLKHL